MLSNRTSVKFIVSAIICLIVASASCSFPSRTISSNRIDEPSISFGYELTKPIYFGGLSIKFWDTRGLDLKFYDSNLSVIKITEERWIGDNRAVYLNLDLAVAKDSYSERRTDKLLYDYRQGELYVNSVGPAWRTETHSLYTTGNEQWLSEEEFQKTLFELNK